MASERRLAPLTTTDWIKKGGERVMETGQVVMILACDGHVETIRRMLDDAKVGSWIVLSGEQARRAGHLAYVPLWPSTAPHIMFGFADRTVTERMLEALTEAVHSGGVCPTCVAFTWEGKQALTPRPVRDPVCRTLADHDHALKETYKATTYYFCSADCRDRFVRDPERYPQRGV